VVGEMAGKVAILIEDLADTCNTEVLISETILELGATQVYIVVTHGILSGNAIDIINKSSVREIIITNTIATAEKQKACSKLKVIDISSFISEAIRRIHYGDSISAMFSHSVNQLTLVKSDHDRNPK